jgi:uncharacterized protein (DUF427 family)
MTEQLRIEPGPGQESVFDYPRPPRIEKSKRWARVVFFGQDVASSGNALRVLETYGAPTIYIPRADVHEGWLEESDGDGTWCEWKGEASYLDLRVQMQSASRAAWRYRNPKRGFELLKDHYSFYPARVQACYLDDELVTPQPGGFYGGWVTADIVGPIKGEPGTLHW